MVKDMTIMMVFSINVASVIGSFNAVPKHAHFILFLFNKVFDTPTVVIPKIISVATREGIMKILIKKNRPRINSING